ncbi:MAG: PilZ domain-containing protein [Pseudomonadota bacterium]|nr:PilZ domain-containing protein [Pseudomonadota bacterium]
MRKAHLAILPVAEGRKAERRIVNLAASLREPGASLADAEVVNLSTGGFAADSDAQLEVGAHVWLKLPGLEPVNSRVVWVDGRKAGFEFVTPLHSATLDLILAARRKPIVKRHFGFGAGRPAGLAGR